LPGSDHLPWEGDAESVLGEIERFISGLGGGAEPDRVLATLLVAELLRPAAAPHGGGSELAARHRRLVQSELGRFRGREVEAAGDRLLATFDGPARAVRCGRAIVGAARELGLDARAGVHAGEIERTRSGVAGTAVDVGAG